MLTDNMSRVEYLKYMKEIDQAKWHINRYKNYSISPWVVKKYGFEAVKKDFETQFSPDYCVRMAVRNEPTLVKGGGTRGYCKGTYFILEKKKKA